MILWRALVRMLLTIYYVGEILKYQGSFLTCTACSYTFLLLEISKNCGLNSEKVITISLKTSFSKHDRFNRFAPCLHVTSSRYRAPLAGKTF